MRSTRSGVGSRRGSKMDAEQEMLMEDDNQLQSEYITNLQQQIYFLELELQVMKEKQQSGRFAGKALSTNVPLDTHMNSLRDKYMSMEKKFKKKIRKMEEDAESLTKKNEELTMKLDRSTSLNQELADSVEQHEADAESARNSYLADKLKLENRVEKLNDKLSEKNNLYEGISDKYRAFRIEARTEIDGLKDERKHLQKQLEDQKKVSESFEATKKAVEVKLIESEESVHLKSEEIASLKNENFNGKDVIRGWEHKCKKLEMDIDQEKEISTKYERENQNLRKNILELEQEIKDEQKKIAEMNKSENRWSHNIVDLRTEIEKQQTAMDAATEQIASLQIQIHQLTEDGHRTNEQMTDVKDKLAQSNEQLVVALANTKKLEDKNLELKKDNILKTDVVDRFDSEKERLTKEVDKLREQNECFQVEINALKQKLNVANKLENINLDEFKTLCSTNLRVADSIKTLMSSINTQSHSMANMLQQNDVEED